MEKRPVVAKGKQALCIYSFTVYRSFYRHDRECNPYMVTYDKTFIVLARGVAQAKRKAQRMLRSWPEWSQSSLYDPKVIHLPTGIGPKAARKILVQLAEKAGK